MNTIPPKKANSKPFRQAVLRGLGVLLPPLLTLVFFLWAWSTIEQYILEPVEWTARSIIVWQIADIRDKEPVKGGTYVEIPGGQWIPHNIRETVRKKPGDLSLSTANANQYYHQFVRVTVLDRKLVIPIFLGIFVILLYLLGKLLAARVGGIFLRSLESLIKRLPFVRTVYSSVKQVTDFVFTERDIEFTRVVAVEYPRKGIWSIGFVTGHSMLRIKEIAEEPVISVLMPTSPMPATGFTITVRKSETVELDISIDQAIQFVVSCGVVVPSGQPSPSALEVDRQIAGALEAGNAETGSESPPLTSDPSPS